MTAEKWQLARNNREMTQAEAAKALGMSQPYLSQLENGARVANPDLSRKAMVFYGLSASVLPVSEAELTTVEPDSLEKELAALGYPGFAHVRSDDVRNPAEVVFRVVTQPDLDTRLVEALPWVIAAFPDLDWRWLCDHVKLRNTQNRLGYLVYLAKVTTTKAKNSSEFEALCTWERVLDEARLVRETTLCRESMPKRERDWVRSHRLQAAEHWNVLTSLTPEQLRYAA
ncbi:MAG TPA: helix-turn-helix transcriptional regulator [Candidatus Sulfopaludibacter sp.]|jgi:transcriptional regulator with XRE-family HTH domain|nr:helix-turn-helix transcriptional regulator [Candidatus Sulfopaludibacter sp.]